MSIRDLEVILESVLTWRIQPREGMARLRPFAVCDFDGNPSYVHWRESLNVQVTLAPTHVQDSFNRYLSGIISERDLRDWAIFITLTMGYSSPPPPEEDEDWFDPMWDALHEVASPEVFGEISEASVRSKLATLDDRFA